MTPVMPSAPASLASTASGDVARDVEPPAATVAQGCFHATLGNADAPSLSPAPPEAERSPCARKAFDCVAPNRNVGWRRTCDAQTRRRTCQAFCVVRCDAIGGRV